MLKSNEPRRVICVCILLTVVKQNSKRCGSFRDVYLRINLATLYTYKSFCFKICNCS